MRFFWLLFCFPIALHGQNALLGLERVAVIIEDTRTSDKSVLDTIYIAINEHIDGSTLAQNPINTTSSSELQFKLYQRRQPNGWFHLTLRVSLHELVSLAREPHTLLKAETWATVAAATSHPAYVAHTAYSLASGVTGDFVRLWSIANE